LDAFQTLLLTLFCQSLSLQIFLLIQGSGRRSVTKLFGFQRQKHWWYYLMLYLFLFGQVCDFGLSRKKKNTISGSLLWLAPEYLIGNEDYNAGEQPETFMCHVTVRV
jgi:serine/threonine protein kinase